MPGGDKATDNSEADGANLTVWWSSLTVPYGSPPRKSAISRGAFVEVTIRTTSAGTPAALTNSVAVAVARIGGHHDTVGGDVDVPTVEPDPAVAARPSRAFLNAVNCCSLRRTTVRLPARGPDPLGGRRVGDSHRQPIAAGREPGTAVGGPELSPGRFSTDAAVASTRS